MNIDPLAGIDDIAWDELRHAYGTAEGVPDALRGFLSDAEDEAEDAHAFVTGSLWHQGTIFPATAVAIPFLVALLGAPGVARRGSLLAGLVGIAAAAAGTGSTSAARRAALRALEKSAPALVRAATKLDGSVLADGIAFVFAMVPAAARRSLGQMPGSIAGAVVEAMERAQAIAAGPEGERDRALWEWQQTLDERVEGVEVDPPRPRAAAVPAPPAPTPVEPPARALEASFDDWVEWDPAKEGPSPGQVFDAEVKAELARLSADCEAARLPPRVDRGRATSTFLQVREAMLRAEHPVPRLRTGGVGCELDDTVRIEWPAWVDGGRRRDRFAVRAVVGPIRALAARLRDGSLRNPEIALERGEGRFTLVFYRPVAGLTFATFALAVDAVLGERERLLAHSLGPSL